ncbi:YbhB/YbcL family Raf kinase inhibitor-like protein [Glaciihabitans sp. dw_435]|uniref:YbhB/YbcL family Raf kinase inhibitor-like protein n=1 Tax=Glaciihabitans sp. dw_435 TaxID=2720081 RepID=UPI001BD25873|nr:YbhB/YbcL family Raf kinase inhibitor-like protein [Glaciihabitans sp. dw_435]
MTENDPFARIPEVPSFTVTSTDVADGVQFAPAQMSGAFGVEGGGDVSPQLSWSGAPEGTQGYAITVYDPDAPTQAGFWHWAVVGIPADVTSLPAGAGAADGALLPAPAFQLPNDARQVGFIGGAPPAGHGPHRYFVTVHALDVPTIDIPADSTPTFLAFNMLTHVIGRAIVVPIAEITE